MSFFFRYQERESVWVVSNKVLLEAGSLKLVKLVEDEDKLWPKFESNMTDATNTTCSLVLYKQI